MPIDVSLTLTDDEMNALRMWRQGSANAGAFSVAWTNKIASLIPAEITIELPAILAIPGEFSEDDDETAYPILEPVTLHEAEAMALRAVRAAVLAMEKTDD